MELSWELGRGEQPEDWIPAQVPGAVQLDWAASQGWAPHWQGSNWRQYLGLENDLWTYRTTLPSHPGPLLLRFKGIDYERTIFLNDEVVHQGAGMAVPFELILDLPEPAELRVVLHPAPKDPSAPAPNHEFRRSTKPGVSYGWDFHPRLIPLGIWDEVDLVPLASGMIHRIEAEVVLSEDLSVAQVRLTADTDSEEVRWEVLDPSGLVTATGEGREALVTLGSPHLWWPHDQGEPCLYTAVAQAGDHSASLKFGIRRVRLVMHEGAWDYPNSMPKSRSHPPMTLEVNGRRVFAKGSNWVPPDIFPGAVQENLLKTLLRQAKGANMNLLRVWGGGPVQKDAFYQICDSLGIMVWQEFPLACSLYPDDKSYLDLLDLESRAIIRKLRGHPSVVLWCGGNELFNSWSGMTDQSLALRRLNANCLELDPQTPFIPTSPQDGVGHGGYTFLDLNTKKPAWESFQESSCTAYCEFGCGGIANLETLKSFIPEDELFPPLPGGVWEEHHAFNAWCGNSWLTQEHIDLLLGPSETLDELVLKGQLLQAEGFKGLFEEARRQKPVCGMALNWCFNEPWPTAANNSLISWPCHPKQALAAVREALRPALASARIPRFVWWNDEPLILELWMLNDSPGRIEEGCVSLLINGVLKEEWQFTELQPFTNLKGPRVELAMDVCRPGALRVDLDVEGRPELSSSYFLRLKASGE